MGQSDCAYGTAPFYITIAGKRFSTSWVDLYVYEIGLTDADIVPLLYMVNLRFLSLAGNQTADWSPVAHVEDFTGRPK